MRHLAAGVDSQLDAEAALEDELRAARLARVGVSAEVEEAALRRFPDPACLLGVGDPDPLQHLAQGLLLEKTISSIVGEDESFKSTVCLAIMVAVAGGLPVLGAFATARPRRVLLVSEEDELGVIQNRIGALIVGMGWQEHRETILGNIFVHALDGFLLDDVVSQAHLLIMRDALEVELMVFDPLADLVAGEENSATAARPVKRLWRQLIAQGCAVLVVIHWGKPAEGKADRDRMRGSSAWRSAMRTVYSLKRTDDGLEVTCQKMSRTRRPDPFQVDLEVIAEEGNPAMWKEARLTVAGRSGDWRLKDVRRLTPSDRKALSALDDFRGEALSWTRWQEVSGLASSTLAKVKTRLVSFEFVEAIAAGKLNRFKQAEYRYSITGAGISALIPLPDSQTPAETPGETPGGASAARLPDSTPPFRGVGPGRPAVNRNGSPDSRFPESGSLSGHGDSWEPPAT